MGATIVILWTGMLVIAVLLTRARFVGPASAWVIRAGIVIALAGAALPMRGE